MDMTGLTERKVQVITGMRGVESEATVDGTHGVPLLPIVPAGQLWFRSRGRALRLHMGKLPDKYDSVRGTNIPGYEFTALFEDHQLRLPEYYNRHFVPVEHREEFQSRLMGHPMQGIEFWNIMDLHSRISAEEEAQARNILARNPKLRSALIEEATQSKGFVVGDGEAGFVEGEDSLGDSVDAPAEEPVPAKPISRGGKSRKVAATR
jgi:hypothetical protein